MSKVIHYQVLGMHCASCELWLEDVLSQVEGVQKVNASYTTNVVEITTEENQNEGVLTPRLQKALLSRPEYQIVPNSRVVVNTQIMREGRLFLEWIIPVGASVTILTIFFGLQTLAMLPFFSSGTSVTFPLIFLIGLIASVSTCATTVGSLVLGVSTTFAQMSPKKAMFALGFFHASRIVSFFVLGGFLGLFGSSIALGFQAQQTLRIIVQASLLLLGLHLIGMPFVERFLPKLPKYFSKSTFSVSRGTSFTTPVLLGALTFLLPCGFTQSMQLQALESGSFTQGALTMFVFALGTFPVLFGISRLSTFLSNQKTKQLFYRTSGLIVITFAVWEIYLALKILFFL